MTVHAPEDSMPQRLPSAVISGALLLALTAPAVAQDEDSLAGAFPDSVGDIPIEVGEESGADWVARFDTGEDIDVAVIARTNALVEGLDATLEDLTIASATLNPTPDNVASIAAVRVTGRGAHELIDGAIDLLLGDVLSPSIQVVYADGRDLLKVRDAEILGAYPRTLLPDGETLWIIEADQDVLGEILSQLPQSAARPTPVFDLASTIP